MWAQKHHLCFHTHFVKFEMWGRLILPRPILLKPQTCFVSTTPPPTPVWKGWVQIMFLVWIWYHGFVGPFVKLADPIEQHFQRTAFVRDGARFGQTEAGFRLRFGLRVNRIFGSETEDEVLRRSRAEHQVCGVKYVFGKYNTQLSMVPRTQKSVFNSTSE